MRKEKNKMKLSKLEKETIILTSEGDDMISIYTFNNTLKRRLKDYAEKYPEYAKFKCSTKEGSATYVLKKSRVSIRLLSPISEERHKAASEYAKKYGLNGSCRISE